MTVDIEVRRAGKKCWKCDGVHRVPDSATFEGRITGIHFGCKRYVKSSTVLRWRGESKAERRLRFRREQFDALPSELRVGRRRPGSVKS